MPPTSGLPTADSKVDLTGREQEHVVQHASMPMMNRYRCLVCGHEVIEAGGFGQRLGRKDAIDELLRGDDFKAEDDVSTTP